MKIERLTSNVVLFLIVALAISQGSVATHLWCGVMFSYEFSPDFVNEIIVKIGWYLVKLRRS